MSTIQVSTHDRLQEGVNLSYLWEGTVVPEIALVWEAVANETKLALLDILLDRVQKFFFRNLRENVVSWGLSLA